MTEIRKAGEVNALDNIDVPQGEFRSQIAALNDAVRQLGGKAEIAPGSTVVNDPLSAPYVLYVNSYTGSDTFVAADYASADDGSFDQKMRRISNQRLECGYTEARPFRTINRAVIEAAIITSRDYLNIDPAPCGDLVSIIVSPGSHTILNDGGSAAADVNAWSDGHEPTDAELIAFNPETVGGLILPRGVSICSLDLRKTILRPNAVPASEDDAPALRRCIFRMTGGGYYYGLTFMDRVGTTTSHHLLSCFEYASEAQLDAFYSKVRNAVGEAVFNNFVEDDYAVTRQSEWQTVGDFPAQDPPATSDTVAGSSPYIYNCSLRSVYGMCGVYADGDAVSGLQSTVIAQFTGVSLQRDMTCFQRYSGGTWTSLSSGDFETYRDESPNNIRMNPNRRSVHIRALNDALIQEVSVFAIGQGVHHLSESGGEITITNSNSNFGHVASLARGYQDTSLAVDSDWIVNRLVVADDMSAESNNVKKIPLGIITGTANDATTITLTENLDDSPTNPGTPNIVAIDGYTLKEDSLLWVENRGGRDYYSPLAATAWTVGNANQLVVKEAFENENGQTPEGTNSAPDLNGLRVYIRRLTDTRSIQERQYSLLLNTGNANARTPIRDYVVQTDTDDANIATEIPDSALITVARSAKKTATGGWAAASQIELRRNNADNTWAASTYYRTGDVIQQGNKHWIATVTHTSGVAFDATKWEENYVHMQEAYRPEDYYKNAQPLIVFDDDTDEEENSTDLGWFAAGRNWNDNADLQAQYRTATDYKGMHSFLVSLGFSAGNAHTILLPKPPADRERDPGSALDGIGNPNGAATAWDNWHIEMRRPSGLRLFAHAWEYTGWSNYTKALPKYQGELSEGNKFTYYFTNENGGRVYPSGFNEEGFAVSSRGIENIETGEVLSPELISSGDQEIIEQPVFNTPATQTTQGLVRIASTAQINQAINGQVVDKDDTNGQFEYVVRVDELTAIRQQILNSVGLLNDRDRIFYVAANINDVPDATVVADGAALNDDRPLDERKTATYCANLPEAFQKIDNRNSLGNDPIIIKTYTSTTSTSACTYSGTGRILIEPGADDGSLGEMQTCSFMRFYAASDLELKQANLRFTTQGIRGDSLSKLYIGGGRYELNSTVTTQYHNMFFVPQAEVKIDLMYYIAADNYPGATVDLHLNGDSGSLGPNIFVCKSFNLDTRHTDTNASPGFNFTSSHQNGGALCDLVSATESINWYAGPGVSDTPNEYQVNINLTGSDFASFSLLRPTATANGSRLNITTNDSTEEGGLTVSFTAPAACTFYSSVNFEAISCNLRLVGNQTGDDHLVARLAAAANTGGAGIVEAEAYHYGVGAGSTVNGVFYDALHQVSEAD